MQPPLRPAIHAKSATVSVLLKGILGCSEWKSHWCGAEHLANSTIPRYYQSLRAPRSCALVTSIRFSVRSLDHAEKSALESLTGGRVIVEPTCWMTSDRNKFLWRQVDTIRSQALTPPAGLLEWSFAPQLEPFYRRKHSTYYQLVPTNNSYPDVALQRPMQVFCSVFASQELLGQVASAAYGAGSSGDLPSSSARGKNGWRDVCTTWGRKANASGSQTRTSASPAYASFRRSLKYFLRMQGDRERAQPAPGEHARFGKGPELFEVLILLIADE